MDGPSYSWYNTFDRMFNPIPKPDPSKHLPTLRHLLEALTSSEVGWKLSDIHLFGWGQGGTMALELASHLSSKPLNADQRRFGSVISICAPILSLPGTLSQTPALTFTRISPSSAAHQRLANDLKKAFKDVEVVNGEKGKGGEDMPRGRNEWEGIMRFWGNVLAKDEGWKGEGEVYEVVR
jgi:pimeloyl-ACP methyl ester carboxylesterase